MRKIHRSMIHQLPSKCPTPKYGIYDQINTMYSQRWSHLFAYRQSIVMLLGCLLLVTTAAVGKSQTDAGGDSQFWMTAQESDSTEVQKAKLQLEELKKYTTLSDDLEEVLLRIFIINNSPANIDDTEQERIRKNRRIRHLELLIGDEAFARLEAAGLIEEWFNPNR